MAEFDPSTVQVSPSGQLQPIAEVWEKAPTPEVEGAAVESYKVPESHLNSTVTCTIRGQKGVPLDAKIFARVIKAQAELLEALGEPGYPIVWCITEANIIGEDGSFSLTGYPKDGYKKSLAEAKRAAKKGANK